MATTRLKLYNAALAAVPGERRLASLTEDRDPRHRLDEVWDRGTGIVNYFLEQGLWNFGIRSLKIDKSTSVTPSFGFSHAFDVPTDYARLASIAADEYFDDPLVRYEIEGQDYIYADVDPLYVRYVSNDAAWGADMSKWPETFTKWCGLYLAQEIAPGLTNEGNLEKIEGRTRRALADAHAKDASEEPPRWPPLSSWNRARFGHRQRRDRGSRSVLTG